MAAMEVLEEVWLIRIHGNPSNSYLDQSDDNKSELDVKMSSLRL